MSGIVKVAGIPFPFADGERIIPPIALGALEQLQTRIAAFKGGIDGESITTVIDSAYAALRRNYPDITREQVADMVDVGNMIDVFQSVMDVSGALRKAKAVELGEAAPP